VESTTGSADSRAEGDFAFAETQAPLADP